MRPSAASANGAVAGRYQVPRWLRRYWKNRQPGANESPRSSAPEVAAAIAIVGVSARLPMASDLGQLWDNLVAGKDCITRVPPGRWDWRGIRGDSADSESGIAWGGFIDGVDEFDPQFFNISPREAALMDPQQRLLLLHVRQAMEDAGYAAGSFAGTETGVFVGALGHDYIRLSTRAGRPAEGYTSTGVIPSIGPGRVSHHFDLRGPSEVVETACASALVAIHRAVCAIRNGECNAAVAAAVNLLLTPDMNLSFVRAGMMSPDGRCKVFSKEANGYVRGEGIGVVLLKELSAAERDGDHIYGVIRATAVNHGGRSRSMTAPNPEAQAELLYRAYSQAGIDPSTVSYIETHGTGTALGDPIETEALKAAFDRLYRERGAAPRLAHCGLGSVKSNIGHLECAAGIAGLLKVILQLKHQTLVPTLYCEPLNPFVALDDSPFYLVRETQPWAPRVENGQQLPRRAGVSSFGFGGVNAHLVLEEHRPAERQPVRANVFPVLLSARDPGSLDRQAAALLRDAGNIELDPHGLLDASYTLACGREVMRERLGFMAGSVAELQEKLAAFLNRNAGGASIHPAQASPAKVNIEDGKQQAAQRAALLSESLSNARVSSWVEGADVDWAATFAAENPRRRSLPPCAFSLRKFPLPRARAAGAPASPLNVSSGDVIVRRCDMTLNGSERFLEHHVIQGERVLPAVMYLEAARCAFQPNVQELDAQHSQLLRFRDVSWTAPLVVREPVGLSIWLHATAHRQARFEAGVRGDDAVAPATVNATGMIEIEPAGARPALDLAQARSRCTRALYSHEQCYEAFAGLGFNYGPEHRAIRSLQLGQNEILAHLELAESPDAADQGVLQPGILDGALQSIIGFQLGAGAGWRLGPCSRPFKCASVEVFASTHCVSWALLTACDTRRDDIAAKSFDIDLCREDGVVCVRFRQFTIRDATHGRLTAPSAAARGLFVAPFWTSLPATPDNALPQSAGVSVIIGGAPAECEALRLHNPDLRIAQLNCGDGVDELRRKLEEIGDISHLLWMVAADAPASLCDESILTSQSHGLLFALNLTQALLAMGYGTRPLSWTTVTRGAVALHRGEQANPTHAGLQGFMGAVAKEYPHWRLQVVDVAAMDELPAPALLRPFGVKRALYACRNGRWFQRQACVIEQMPDAKQALAPGSVCVIIGGAGGIGQAISRTLLQQSQVQLVWIGRRAQDLAIQAMIDELALSGPAPYYIRADASDRTQLAHARNTIEKTFGRIDGLIHAAMVLRDHSLERMSAASLREVLVPKIDGCLRLAQVFGTADLRLALFFSSMNSFSTSAGQSNYAAASCFEDAFALELAKSWRCPVRVINWGYWGQVGAVASEYHRLHMARTGIASIETPDAMRAIEKILAAPLTQCGYIKVAASVDLEALGVDADHRLLVNEPAPAYHPTDYSQSVAWQAGQPAAFASEQETFDSALLRGLWHQLRAWCGFDEPVVIESVREQAGIQRKFTPWFERSVDELVAHGYLQRSGRLVRATAKGRQGTAQAIRLSDAFEGNEQRRKQWEFAQTMLRALPDILTGRRTAVEVMFAEPVATLMAESYRDSPAVSYCDRLLAAVAADCVAQRLASDAHARIRLLEVGAGRGATTRRVVEALGPYQHVIAEYAYTDISPAFLEAERNADRMLPAYVSYRMFDVESDPERQGLALGTYDIVIAGNVLHATQSLEQTLRHCKSLLRGGGVLLLHELTSNPVFPHLTYGLLDGWWRFGDHGWRMPGGPAAPPQAWREVLSLAGFRNVMFPAERSHSLGHQVVVAQSDGIVLLQRAAVRQEPAVADVRALSTVEAPAGEASPEIAMDDLLPQLRALVAQVLGMAEAELDQQSRPFADALLGELGMDSLASINLRKSIRVKFGVEVSTQKILGQRAATIADAIYKQQLLRRMVSRASLPDAAEVEVFTF